MNKAEKALAKKVMLRFNSPSQAGADFTRDENLILERWRTLKMINENVFRDVTTMADDHKQYLQVPGYPFTHFGEQEQTKSGYMRFRESKWITILRDAFVGFSFLVSLYVTISKVFQK